MKKIIAILGVAVVGALPSVVLGHSAFSGTVVLTGQATGVTTSNPLSAPMTIDVPGVVTVTIQASGPAKTGTLTISGPASCSTTGGHSLTCTFDAPAGSYQVVYTPDGTANSVSVSGVEN